MASSIQSVKVAGFTASLPQTARPDSKECRAIFEANRNRVYALAFWATDSELAAEELMTAAFARAFSQGAAPAPEAVDRALLAEIRELRPVGVLTLQCGPSQRPLAVRRNMKRVHLERAVMQVPITERMIYLMHDGEGYDHARIARTLGVSEQESQNGLHQARLRIRELVAEMAD